MKPTYDELVRSLQNLEGDMCRLMRIVERETDLSEETSEDYAAIVNKMDYVEILHRVREAEQ